MTDMQKRAWSIQLNNCIHHAYIQLLNRGAVDILERENSILDSFQELKNLGINVNDIKDSAQLEIATGMYLLILSKIGNETSGPDTISTYVSLILKQI